MSARGWLTASCLLFACKGTPRPEKAVEARPAPAAASPKAATQRDDPDFVHVDRDQLAALCLAARLPTLPAPSDDGVLALADGSRVPWLTVWVDDEQAAAADVPVPTAKAWTTRATASVQREMARLDGPPPRPSSKGVEWRNQPCDGAEAYRVVVTAVFFQKDAFHAVAMRGKKLLEATLPRSTPRDTTFKKAFELTETILGQSATVGSHEILGSGEPSKTVETRAWLEAASAGPGPGSGSGL